VIEKQAGDADYCNNLMYRCYKIIKIKVVGERAGLGMKTRFDKKF